MRLGMKTFRLPTVRYAIETVGILVLFSLDYQAWRTH